MTVKEGMRLIDRLEKEHGLPGAEMAALIDANCLELRDYARARASTIRDREYGKDIYIRGLIEFTNYCKNDCYYCGIRRSNAKARRYRLTEEEILECCWEGERLGFRTFVLQGGEDPYFTDERMVRLIRRIRAGYPDCAITLSIGERSRESYERFYEAGADRYLLRHETASEEHYQKLHPSDLSLKHRKQCLWDLKEIGYQTGCGFMVGSPGQTAEHLAEDFLWIKELHPEMVGIGPFIPHSDTPFAEEVQGSLELTLYLLSLLRIQQPDLLLPSTTALATIHPKGREWGIQAGANVLMPNLSPAGVREKYALYDGKASTGDEAAEYKEHLQERMKRIGYRIVTDRGDHKLKRSRDLDALSAEEEKRYGRQMILPEVGSKGQLKLKKSKVLIIGAGGLGSPAAMYLAGAGVGTIGIMDADVVSISNLQRQIVHNMAGENRNKAESAKLCLQSLNDKIEVKAYPYALTAENAEEIISGYDFAIDAADNFETKFLINDACVLLEKPFCHAGVLRFQGQVMTYVPGDAPCFRCIFEEVPQNGTVPNCKQAGIIGAVAGIIGSVQALEAIKYLLGAGELLTGKLFMLDGLSMKTRIVKFKSRNLDCKVCGRHRTITDIKEHVGEYARSENVKDRN